MTGAKKLIDAILIETRPHQRIEIGRLKINFSVLGRISPTAGRVGQVHA